MLPRPIADRLVFHNANVRKNLGCDSYPEEARRRLQFGADNFGSHPSAKPERYAIPTGVYEQGEGVEHVGPEDRVVIVEPLPRRIE